MAWRGGGGGESGTAPVRGTGDGKAALASLWGRVAARGCAACWRAVMDAMLSLTTKSIGHSGPRVTNEQDFPLSEWCVWRLSTSCSKLAAELVGLAAEVGARPSDGA